MKANWAGCTAGGGRRGGEAQARILLVKGYRMGQGVKAGATREVVGDPKNSSGLGLTSSRTDSSPQTPSSPEGDCRGKDTPPQWKKARVHLTPSLHLCSGRG